MIFPKINYFFDLDNNKHQGLFNNLKYPWEALEKLDNYVTAMLKGKKLSIGQKTIIDKTVRFDGPIIIGENSNIGFNTCLRGPLIIGDNCLIKSSEIKHSILLNNVETNHFTYIGDSLVGNKVGFGGGAKTANLRFDWELIKISYQGKKILTKLQKFGAVIGDGTKLGCNSVINPGSVIGKNCLVYPLTCVRSKFYDTNAIIKNER